MKTNSRKNRGPDAKSGVAVEPRLRRRYTLEELLAQCDPRASRSTEEQEWIDSTAVGRELV